MDFSKVKSFSIPQGEVKDISVSGVKVWEEQTTPTYTVSGVWEFNDRLILNGYEDFYVNFTSNGVTYSRIWFELEQNMLLYDSLVVYNNSSDDRLNGFLSNAYKTVDFGSTPQEVSQEFYEWFTANATRKVISFTIDGTSYQAYEGMTWEDWVNSSFNTDGYNLGVSVVMFRGGGIVEYSNGDSVRPTDIITATNYILGSHSGGGN